MTVRYCDFSQINTVFFWLPEALDGISPSPESQTEGIKMRAVCLSAWSEDTWVFFAGSTSSFQQACFSWSCIPADKFVKPATRCKFSVTLFEAAESQKRGWSHFALSWKILLVLSKNVFKFPKMILRRKMIIKSILWSVLNQRCVSQNSQSQINNHLTDVLKRLSLHYDLWCRLFNVVHS